MWTEDVNSRDAGNGIVHEVGFPALLETVRLVYTLQVSHHAEWRIRFNKVLLVKPNRHFHVETVDLRVRALLATVEVLAGLFGYPNRLVKCVVPF